MGTRIDGVMSPRFSSVRKAVTAARSKVSPMRRGNRRHGLEEVITAAAMELSSWPEKDVDRPGKK